MRLRSPLRLSIAVALAGGLAVAAFATARTTQPVTGASHFLGRFEWTWEDGTRAPKWFGGFSALELSADGSSMTILTDRSRLLTATIQRDGTGITGIRPATPVHLRTSTGKIMYRKVVDSEGLALAPDGSVYVSFEGISRVVHYSEPDAPARVLPRPEGFTRFPKNRGPEALAMDASGQLYTLPENHPDEFGQIPVWRWDGQQWSVPFTLPMRGEFLPVGADFGPDGRFYLLERDFSILGFRSRLRRWALNDDSPVDEEILFQTAFGTYDNLEGVSIWRDGLNRLRATLVSDDNFLALQQTEIVEYHLPD